MDQLHNWTSNLYEYFPVLPDGGPIKAEHLARIGRHSEALKSLLALQERGLPIFCYGLSYAIDRLRLYTAAVTTFNPQDLAAAKNLLIRLQRYGMFVDFEQPFLTFTGLNVTEPDNQKLPQDVSDIPGLPLVDCFEKEKQATSSSVS